MNRKGYGLFVSVDIKSRTVTGGMDVTRKSPKKMNLRTHKDICLVKTLYQVSV